MASPVRNRLIMHCKPLSIEYFMYVYGLCLLFDFATKNLHFATIFYHLVDKCDLRILLISSPVSLTKVVNQTTQPINSIMFQSIKMSLQQAKVVNQIKLSISLTCQSIKVVNQANLEIFLFFSFLFIYLLSLVVLLFVVN